MNPYPEYITDEASGIQVPNDLHTAWEAGYQFNYLMVEKALISCCLCGKGFWFKFANEIQECPWCGGRNYRKAIAQVKRAMGKVKNKNASNI